MNADDTIDVIALWRLLWGQRVVIAIFAGVFGAVAVILALTATPVYRAVAVVTPVADPGLGGVASRLAGQFGGLASLAGIDVGSSRSLDPGSQCRAGIPPPDRGICPAERPR